MTFLNKQKSICKTTMHMTMRLLQYRKSILNVIEHFSQYLTSKLFSRTMTFLNKQKSISKTSRDNNAHYSEINTIKIGILNRSNISNFTSTK